MKKNLAILIVIFAVTAASGFGLRLVFAFTEPSGSPPSSNTEPPITTSSTGQSKAGGLNVATSSGTLGVGASASGTYKLEVIGGTLTGIYGSTSGTNTFGLAGVASGSATGVSGSSASGTGIYGSSTSGTGISGLSASGSGGLFYSTGGNYGLYSAATSTSVLTYGGYFKSKSSTSGSAGAYAINTSATGSVYGLYAQVNSTNASSAAVYGRNTGGSGWAGYFEGPAKVTGNLTIDGTITVGGGGTVFGSGTTNYLSKWTAASSLGNSIIFDNGTNVGIGTTSPGAKLHIYESATTGSIRVGGSNGVGNSRVYIEANGDTSTIDSYGDNTFKTLRINASPLLLNVVGAGNVGIGTTDPSTFGDVNTVFAVRKAATMNIHFGSDTTKGILAINEGGDVVMGSKTNHPLSLKTNNATVMTLTTSGNVGIGTTSPGAKIEISSTGGNHLKFTRGLELYWQYMTSGGDLIFSDGSDRVTFLKGGNVGVGTTSPAYKLDVQGTGTVASFNGPIIVGTPTSASHSATKSYVDSVIGGGGASGSFATLTVTGSTYLATTSGNVGIGTTAPAGKLDVTGRTYFRASADTTPALTFVNAAGGDGSLYISGTASTMNYKFNTYSTDGALYIQNNGNVGIGDTVPEEKLTVVGGLKLADTNSRLYFGSNGGTSYRALEGNTAGTLLQIGEGYSQTALYGNIGIGTTSPVYKLDVAGTAYFSQPVIVGTPTAASHAATKSYVDSSITGNISGTANYISKFTGSNSLGNSVIYETGGNIGIGTTGPGSYHGSANNLVVYETGGSGGITIATDNNLQGGIFFADGTTGDQAYRGSVVYDHSNDYMYFRTAGNAWPMVIDNSGNIGVGTTSPSYKLDVNGNTRITGDLTVTGTITTGGGTSGWVNANNGIWSNSSLYMDIDNDNNGTEYFIVRNGADASTLQLDETGNLQTRSTIYPGTGSAIQSSYGIWQTGSGLATNGDFYASGNVGIGTTGPGAKLDVAGNVDLSGAGATLFTNWVSGRTGTGLELQTGGQTRVTITNGGNVGIGTTSPNYKLDVVGRVGINVGGSVAAPQLLVEGDGAAYNPQIALRRANSVSATGNIDWLGNTNVIGARIGVNDDVAGAMQFKLGGTGAVGDTKMIILSSGNVGIGTTSPTSLLHLSASGPTNIVLEGAQTDDNSPNIFGQFARGSIASKTISLNGDYVLGLYGRGYDGANWKNAALIGFQVDGTPGTNDMPGRIVFKTTPDGSSTLSERMRIDNNGNVGIGTTSPAYKLDVNGNTRITGDLTVTGTLSYGSIGADWLNANYGVWSNGSLYMDVDNDNNGTEYFIVRNGADATTLQLDETGNLQTRSTIYPGTGSALQSSYGIWQTGSGLRTQGDFYVDGNVGIGTTGPAYKLDVAGGLRVTGSIQEIGGEVYSATGGSFLMNPDSNSAAQPAYAFRGDEVTGMYHVASNKLGFATDGSNKMTIDSTGNVGIGTTSPDPGAQLEIAKSGAHGIFLRDTSVGGATWQIDNARQAQGVFSITESGVGRRLVIMNGTGNVGIGTTAPSAPSGSGASKVLEISDSADPAFVITDTGTSDAKWGILNSGGNLEFYKQGLGNSFILQTDGDAIINTGNVGIGTTGPTEKLQVAGGVKITGVLTTDTANAVGIDYNGGARFVSWGADGTTQGQFLFQGFASDGSPNQEYMRITSVGNVGIGTTSPAYKLDVNGNTNITGNLNVTGTITGTLAGTVTVTAGNVSSGQFGANTGGGNFSFPGNVGIGTTAPTARLSVAGDIHYAGFSGTNMTIYNGQAGGFIYAADENGHRFQTYSGGWQDRLTILDAGNVGIGTTSPGNLLHIRSATQPYIRTDWSNNLAANDIVGLLDFRGNNASGINRQWTSVYGIVDDATNLSEDASIVFQSIRAGAVSEQMRITSTGNVGIGTTGPGARLHVEVPDGWNSSSPVVKIVNNDTTDAEGMGLLIQSGDASTDYILKLKNRLGTEVMHVTGNGDVGIGTTSPSYKLDVNGNTNITGNLNVTGTITGTLAGTVTVTAGNVSSGQFGANTGGGNFSFPGNVGIGTTSPGDVLEINANYSGGNAKGIIIGQNNSLNTNKYSGIFFKRYGNGKFQGLMADSRSTSDHIFIGGGFGGDIAASSILFFTDAFGTAVGTERMRITDTGNVGIGTTSPSGLLHTYKAAGTNSLIVEADDGQTAQLRIGALTDGTESLKLAMDRNTNYAYLDVTNSAGILALQVSGGNVGIGTTGPLAKLHISGGDVKIGTYLNIDATNAALKSDANLNFVADDDNSGSGGFNFITGGISGTNRITVLNNGNVGIGTTSPAYKLDVNGNTNITGNLNVTGTITGTLAGTVTVTAGNVSSGQFGANTGGGNFSFPGNVGIGTTSPVAKLHVLGGSIRSQFDGVAGDPNIMVMPAAGDSQGTGIFAPAIRTLAFATADVERLRITSTGNVGIGTTVPDSPLHVQTSSGNTRLHLQAASGNDEAIWFHNTGANEWSAGLDASDGGKFKFDAGSTVGSATKVTIQQDGNVGIGTTTPTQPLDILASGSASSQIRLSDVATDATTKNAKILARHYTNAEEDFLPLQFVSNSTDNIVRLGGSSGTFNSATMLSFYTAANATTVSGTERMRIDSAGNVGIGTTGPSYKLDVHQASGNAYMRIYNTANADTVGYILQSTGAGGREWFTGIYDGTGKYQIRDTSAGAIRLTVATDGNVGIGTTSPSYKLDVNGNANITGNLNVTGTITGTLAGTVTVTAGNVSSGQFGANTGGGNFSFPGNVGIGTTSPQSLLHLKSANSRIYFGGTNDGTGSTGYFVEVYDSASGDNSGNGRDLTIKAGNTDNTAGKVGGDLYLKPGAPTAPAIAYGDVLLVTDGGNVGIGTTGPGQKLDVEGASPADWYNGQLRIGGTETTGAINTGGGIQFSGHNGSIPRNWGSIQILKEDSTVGGLASYFRVNVRNATDFFEGMRITSQGNVGIGTTGPNRPLHINKSFEAGITLSSDGMNAQVAAHGSNQIFYVGTQNDYPVYFTQNDANAMVIDSSGNVGIGTTSPSEKLHVQGNARITGNLQVDGTFNLAQATYNQTSTATSGSVYNLSTSLTGNPASASSAIYYNSLNQLFTQSGNTQNFTGYLYSGYYQAQHVGTGTVSNLYGLQISYNNTSTGTVSNAVGLRISSANSGGGSVSANYGLLIDDLAGTSAAAIYQSGSNDINYFAGNVGIGTTGPGAKLEIAAVTNSTNNFQIAGTSSTVKLHLGEFSDGAYIFNNYFYNSGHTTDDATKGSSGLTFDANGIAFQHAPASATPTRVTDMFIKNDGNVGIGTTGPLALLNVGNGTDDALTGGAANRVFYGNLNGQANLVIRDSTNDVEARLTAYSGGVIFGSRTNHSLTIRTNDSDVMTINTSGNVGIGTTSPGAKLHVYGDMQLYAGSSGNSSKLYFGTETGAPAKAIFMENWWMVIQPHRNEGLKIRAVDASGNQQLLAQFNGDANADASEIWLAPTGGNVGIGTTGPEAKLDVNGDTIFRGTQHTLMRAATNNYNILLFGTAAGSVTNWGIYTGNVEDAGLAFYNYKNPGTAMYFGYDNNVNIVNNLSVSGLIKVASTRNTYVHSTEDSDNAHIYKTGPGVGDFGQLQGHLVLQARVQGTVYRDIIFAGGLSTAGPLMTIKGTGNVGIGTTSPAYKLDVQGGQINASGGFCIAGDCRASWGAVGGGYWTASGANIYNNNAANVGIGTTGPSNKLHIMGSAVSGSAVDSNAYLRVENNGQTDITIVSNPASKGILSFIDNSGAYPGEINYDHSNDAMNFLTNGSEKVRITSTGNVGIGTTDPGNLLHVRGDATNLAVFEDASSGSKLAFKLDTPAGTGSTISSQIDGIDPRDLLFRVQQSGGSGLDAVAIKSTGNVGIGTTDPGSLLSLSRSAGNADIRITEYQNNNYGPSLFFQQARGTQSSPAIMQANDTITLIRSMGYDGAGFLDVGNITFAVDGTPGTNDMPGRIMFYTTPDGASAVVERVRIDNQGNVGIGTTSPSYKLDVNGNTNITGNLNVTGTITGTLAGTVTVTAGNVSSGQFGANTGGGNFSFPANVGIGTTGPATLLHTLATSDNLTTLQAGAASGIQIRFNHGGTQTGFINSNTTNIFSVYQGMSNEVFAITSGGNVGIGTTSPGVNLHVLGDAGAKIERTGHSGKLSFYIQGAASRITTTDSTTLTLGHDSNVGRLVIDTAGNVGIGTTSPTGILNTVLNSSAAYSTSIVPSSVNGVRIENNNTTLNAYAELELAAGTGGSNGAFARILTVNTDAGAGSNLIFQIRDDVGNTEERMRIDENGNVGIGTTSPSYKLDVNGNTNITGNLNVTGTITGTLAGTVTVTAGNVSSGQFGANTGGGNFSFPGNVGIGTTSPSQKLSIQTSGGGSWMSAGDSVNSATPNLFGSFGDGTAAIYTQSTYPISFYTNTTERVRITSTGNVGIGTTSPGYKLEVVANIGNWASRIYNTYGNGGSGLLVRTDASDTSLGFGVYGTGYNFVVTNAGNVGIGTTSPGQVLDVQGSVAAGILANLTNTNSTGFSAMRSSNATGRSGEIGLGPWSGGHALSNSYYISANSTAPLVFAIDMVEKVRIDTSGNVGIGTTSPTVKLDVNGSAKISGNLDMNGNNVSGVNKLTVTTIDPEYTFDGKKYATYVASFAGGVKEETTGKIKLTTYNKQQTAYEYTIDFDKIDEGSDLWLWHKVIDFSKDNVEVLATPYGELAMIAYQIEGNKIIFKSDKAVEISYRLTGRRNDWKLWPTKLEK